MEKYSIYFRESVHKDLRNIPKAEIKKILSKIQALASNPRPAQSEKLSGFPYYRIRQGNYRIVYSIEAKQLSIWIIKIAHRKEVYQQLK